MANSIIQGSLSALANQSGASLAETFIHCDVIILVDVSGSMGDEDSRNGKSRYEVAMEELKSLQQNLPGKIAVIGFSNAPKFEPSGIATFSGGGTNLTAALKFAKIADVPEMKFVLISDGQPDNETAALEVAKTYTNHIDVVYVGPESRPSGREFLQRLAAATGGKAVTADRCLELGNEIKFLLNS